MNYLIGSLVALLLVFTANVGQYLNNQVSFGSTPIGGEYHSTTTDATWTSGVSKVLQTGPGILGSVIVTLGSAGKLEFYDATTTIHTDRATSTIAIFPTTATAGTYTFDVSFQHGLLVIPTTGAGISSTTITFR